MSDLQLLEDSLYEAEAALDAIRELDGLDETLTDDIDHISVNILAARKLLSDQKVDAFEKYVHRAYESGQRVRLTAHRSDDVLLNYATKLTNSLSSILDNDRK